MENKIMNKEITLNSNCVATIIPAGDQVTLAEGATYTIAQSLGNSVTLRDATGMYRVGEDQLSALGEGLKKKFYRPIRLRSPQGPLKRNRFGMHFADVSTQKFPSILSILALFMI
jgi:hypothetical protein